MATYGIPGDPTYSQTLSGLDEIMSVLPTQDGGAITARNLRDVSFTLWNEVANINTYSFSYTNLTPSTVDVGGFSAGSTFSSVTLQNLFDNLFSPFRGPEFTLEILSPNPPMYEYGYSSGGTATVDLSVTLTRVTNPIISCTLSAPNDSPNVLNPSIPTVGSTTSFFQASVILDQVTTYTLTLSDFDGTTGLNGRQISATVGWYNSRYYGSIDLSSLGQYTDVRVLTASQSLDLDTLIDFRLGLTGPNGLADLNNNPHPILGTSISIPSNSEHLIVAWPSSDWTYSVFPKAINNNFYVNIFKKVKSNYYLENIYGYSENYDIYLSFLPQGTTELTILNQEQ